MSDLMPGEDGFDETRGWDRASIALRSRKPYVPDIRRDDLLLPNETGRLRTLGLCLICAFGITILLGFPLLAFALFVPLGRWFFVSLGGAFLGVTVLLFLGSTRETRQLRRLAREL
jgi:Flp pilus assembly protein TadB